ncbi:MAG TPA: ATP-dependent DNA helicase [Vicinamibacterales bacterium]|nr:ATP-dependent DNA helicase [Vicinamibacterales bacterium]
MPEVPAVPGTVDAGRAGTPTADLHEAVRRTFASGGALAAALPGFEARDAQLQMADAVATVFTDGGVLLAEAGTGTGKTLAYLVPAILSGQRVLVSTGTKNLQEQIFFKDIPLLQASLGRTFSATYMKGRGNYLCLHRFEDFRDTGIHSHDEAHYVRLIDEWREDTKTGDRAEIEDLPEDLPFWTDISASAENCIGSECPQFHDCFITKMRQRAAESDLVIVNHHLLCADAAVRQGAYGEVIPACSYAILDEAHQLEDVATQYFGVAVSNYRVDDFARDVDRALAAGLLQGAQHGTVRQSLEQVRDCARDFFGVLQMVRFDASSAGGGLPGTESRIRVRPQQLDRVGEEGAALAMALRQIEGDLSQVPDAPEDVLALARRAADLRTQLDFLLRADDPSFVYYLEMRGRGVFLRAAPIDVSEIVRELLLDRMKATVLTSATLAVDGSFEYVKRRLGIGDALEVRLASEFDYARQAILYLPPRMPDPRSRDFAAAAAREVVEIVKRTQGRAFVLFTSYANLREVRAIAAAELSYPILVQGEAPRSALLREFKLTPNAVLLATASFWQGVDVVGEALSCVIIDKIPFASPGDPITAARIEAINAEGGSAFGEYQIPLAILTLQQGLGRLIRHRQDRGVLAILDPRLRTMGYGRRFLASLPGAPVTHRLTDIERFLAPQP